MGQKIALDTSVWIYALENNAKFFRSAVGVLEQIESGSAAACFSVIGMIELLTGPKFLGETIIAEQYKHQLANFPNLTIVGISENIVDLSSDLRAKYGLHTPDAIHVATAIDFGASVFITTDKTLKKVKEIRTKIL